jgi:hypothetical protein
MKRMRKSRKHDKDSNHFEGFTGLQHQPGQRVRGASFERHGSEDVFPGQDNRSVSDFKRPSGYHPAQPAVADQIGDAGSHQSPLSTNSNILGDMAGHTKDKPHHRIRKTKILFISLLILALIGVVMFFLRSNHLKISRLFNEGHTTLDRIIHH